jgi:hypothetical protein
MDKLNESNQPDEITPDGPQLPEDEKTDNEIQWETNHAIIGNFIIQHMQQYGSVPGKTVIAQGTGLNRETVNKHIKALAESPAPQKTFDTFSLMTEHVLSVVLKRAMQGDLRAAKMFLENTRAFNKAALEKPLSQTNNFVQINKTVINQQVIQQLTPEQLNQIEQIIASQLDKT